MKQEALAELVQMTQQNVSRYEGTRQIDDKILEKFAKALDVSVEELKTLQEPAPFIVENNNTYKDNDVVNSPNSYCGNSTVSANIHHPIDKMIELYERMLQSRDEQIKELKARVSELEKKWKESDGEKK